MATQFVIPTVFQAIDKMSPAINAMSRSLDAFGNHADVAISRGERAFRRMMTPMRTITTKFNGMMGGLGAPVGIAALGIAAKNTADIFIEFEAANSNLASGLDMTIDQIRPLTEDAKRLGAATKFNASQVSALQFEYAKLGFAPDQILKMTESTLALASATQFELGPTATTVGAAIRAYGLEAKDAARVNDVLAASASKTSLDMSDFYMNLATFAPVAKAFNFSMEDSIALFGKIRDSGFDASSAATALRNIFLNLADSNGKLARALGKPAHTLPELIKGMQTLRDKGVNLAQMLELTDKRSVAAFATLLDNAGAVKTLAGELNNAEGFAKKMADTQLNNVRGSLTIMKAAWEGLVLSIEDGRGKIGLGIRHIAHVATDVMGIMAGTAKATGELTGEERNIRDTAETVMFWGKAALYAAGAMAAWKALLIGGSIAMGVLKAVTIAYNVVANAMFLVSMVKYTAVTQGMTFATAGWTIAQAELNAVLAANPIGVVVTALAALAGITYLVQKRNEVLIEQYQEKIDLDITSEVKKEERAVEGLVEKYVMLGKSIREANAMAMNERMLDLDMKRAASEKKIASLQAELDSRKIQTAGGFGAAGAIAWNYLMNRSETARDLANETETAKNLSVDQSFEVQRAQKAVSMGLVSGSDVAGVFASGMSRKVATPMTQSEGGGGGINWMGPQKTEYGQLALDYNKLREALKGTSRVEVVFKGGNASVYGDVQPQVGSTTERD